jgi:hypothetical protein
MVVGCAPGGGLVGHPPDGMPAPPKKKQMGSASTWARFLMGLGKQRRERRSRHLGVVGLAVGCAPGWGIVFIPSMERRADTMGSASAWPVSPWVLAADAANGWAWQSCSSTSPTLPRRPAPHGRNRPRPHPRLGRSRWTPRRGIHSWGGRLGVSSRLGRVVLPGIRPVLGARLHPSGFRARGQLGGWPRPAVGDAFRRRSRPCWRKRCHARGRVTVAPTLSRSCCSNHRRRRDHLAVTSP